MSRGDCILLFFYYNNSILIESSNYTGGINLMTQMKETKIITPRGQTKTKLVYADTGETHYERIKRLLKEYEE